jgi:hypothetical protein
MTASAEQNSAFGVPEAGVVVKAEEWRRKGPQVLCNLR